MSMMKSTCLLVLLAGLTRAQAADSGQLVRPKPSGRAESKCSQEVWDSITEMDRYNNWTIQDLPAASGFTVAITQWNSIVSSQCFQTAFEHSDSLLSVSHSYPTLPLKTFYYDVSDDANRTDTASTKPTSDAPKIMIAGASKNFAVYAVCNEQSSNLNVHVTYTSSITNDEKKAINKWIKVSNFPIIGRWGAINFETCYLTKTYLCNGGKAQFCSGVQKRTKKQNADSDESAESLELHDHIFGW